MGDGYFIFCIAVGSLDNRIRDNEVLSFAVYYCPGRITTGVQVGSGCRIKVATNTEVHQETQVEAFV